MTSTRQSADHQVAAWQNAASGVANLGPTGRRRHGTPAIGDGIVDFTFVGVAARAALLAANQNDAAVLQHTGSIVAAPETHVGERGPATVEVASIMIRR